MTRRELAAVFVLFLVPAILPAQTSSAKPGAAKASAPSTTRFVLAAEGNEARYRVRERLAGLDFPNDAVGRTSDVTGGFTLDDRGRPLPTASHFVVNLTTLKSDKANRDRYLKTKALETDKFPRAELVITELHGFPTVLPTSGTLKFQLVGTLTIHGVSRPTTWDVNATAQNGEFTGTATTEFKFGDFGMDVPSAFVVMSVDDDIKLEYDFHVVRDTAAH